MTRRSLLKSLLSLAATSPAQIGAALPSTTHGPCNPDWKVISAALGAIAESGRVLEAHVARDGKRDLIVQRTDFPA